MAGAADPLLPHDRIRGHRTEVCNPVRRRPDCAPWHLLSSRQACEAAVVSGVLAVDRRCGGVGDLVGETVAEFPDAGGDLLGAAAEPGAEFDDLREASGDVQVVLGTWGSGDPAGQEVGPVRMWAGSGQRHLFGDPPVHHLCDGLSRVGRVVGEGAFAARRRSRPTGSYAGVADLVQDAGEFGPGLVGDHVVGVARERGADPVLGLLEPAGPR